MCLNHHLSCQEKEKRHKIELEGKTLAQVNNFNCLDKIVDKE